MLKIFGFSYNPNINIYKPCVYKKEGNLNCCLKQLGKDTISFTSRSKNTDNTPVAVARNYCADTKKLQCKERTISGALANKVFQKAQQDTKYLKSTLNKALLPLFDKKQSNYDVERPIVDIEYRTKSANSIREKATQKHLYTKESVIENIHDLVGARIILGSNQKGCADKVIDKLIDCVKQSKLRIVEVENHVPNDSKHLYASQKMLHKLARAASDKYGVLVPEYITRRETGYMGIHLLVKFPDGITGEIQILGHDVAVFKELEDIPYKILQGKSVKKQYNTIKGVFEPMLPISDNPDDIENIERIKLKKEFILYTTAAYKHEREKVYNQKSKNSIPKFLTIDEFSQESKKKLHLTPDLDFNYLYKLKMLADKNA